MHDFNEKDQISEGEFKPSTDAEKNDGADGVEIISTAVDVVKEEVSKKYDGGAIPRSARSAA